MESVFHLIFLGEQYPVGAGLLGKAELLSQHMQRLAVPFRGQAHSHSSTLGADAGTAQKSVGA